MSSALKTLTAAVASAVLLSSAASAAGLGKLTVLSALGQPLRAEIELTAVSNEEAGGLVAKLASAEAYRAANIEFNPALLALRFNVEQRGGRQFVRISSTQPLNEPFVDLLLELAWDNGRLVREYTFLLDPAELRAPQPAQVAAAPAAQRPRAAAPAAAPAADPSAAPAPATRPQRSTRAAERAAAAEEAGPRSPNAASRYRVRRGDTLSDIAVRLKPTDVSLDMMLVALYRANPDAFIGNNMNRLKSGQILTVPAGDTLRGGDAEEARGTVVAHAADFDAYRAKLAGQVATSTPARETAAGQSATGRITARVQERPTAANESQDQLRLSRATPAPATGAAGGANATGATNTEETIAREKELADAQQRVKELETNVNKLEELITVKNGAGAAAAGAAADGIKPLVPANEAANEAANTPAQPAPKIKPKAAKPAPPPEKSLFDTLMDNITVIGAGVAVLALAALGLSQRRKKKPATQGTTAPVAEPSILGAAAQPSSSQSLYAETGGQSIDTSDSVFNSSFAPSASQLDTNEVDPLAEAELYLAYNFDTQAEDILKEALRNDPLRHPVRLKLLEIYAARKDVRAFETQATELYSLTGGKGDEWAQAAGMGLALDPANPMYAAAAGSGIGAGAVAAGAAGIAAGAIAAQDDNNPQTLLSQQLEQAFRSRAEDTGFIEPVSTTDALTGAPLDTGFGLGSVSLDKNATALPQADDTAVPQDAKDAKLDDNLLDFDLGGLSFEPVPASEPASFGRNDITAMPAADSAVPDLQFDMEPFAPLEPDATPAGSVAANSLDDLSFDMDFDSAQPAQAAALAPLDDDDGFVLDLSKNGPATDIDMAELAKEFELPPLPEVPQSPAASDLKDPLFDLDAMDFSLADDTPVTPATPATPGQDFDFSNDLDFASTPAAELPTPAPAPAKDPLFDLDTLDFGQPAAPAAPTDDPFALDDVPAIPNPGTPVPRFDMDSFDLDLPAGDAAPQFAESTQFAPEGEGATTELTPAQMEMETKLDLAIAYQEIGDKEGARELLDEVIKGGSSEQAGRASAMRAQLA